MVESSSQNPVMGSLLMPTAELSPVSAHELSPIQLSPDSSPNPSLLDEEAQLVASPSLAALSTQQGPQLMLGFQVSGSTADKCANLICSTGDIRPDAFPL